MKKGMYANLRFAKHQGYPAKKIEDHHERNIERPMPAIRRLI